MRALAHHTQSLIERDRLVCHLVESEESRVGARPLSAQAAAALRKQWQLVSGQLMTVLIGKDGREKLRRINHVDRAEIWGLLDTMPMRYQAMRRCGDERYCRRGQNHTMHDLSWQT